MVQVQGADEFLRVSKALKAAGRGDLRKALNKGLRDGAKPLLRVAQDSARSEYPRRGGFAAYQASKRGRVAVKTGSTAGVSVVIPKTDPRLDTQGRLSHPVFGRGRVVQRVRAGVYSRALEGAAPQVLDALESTVTDFAEQLARGV